MNVVLVLSLDVDQIRGEKDGSMFCRANILDQTVGSIISQSKIDVKNDFRRGNQCVSRARLVDGRMGEKNLDRVISSHDFYHADPETNEQI